MAALMPCIPKRRVYTAEELTLACHMMEQKRPWRQIAKTLGDQNDNSIRRQIEPGYRENRNHQQRLNSARRRGEIVKKASQYKNPRGFTHKPGQKIEPPAILWEERARAFAGDVTPNHVLLGDPLPGRSALDKRNSA
jgi:hypothetical protein